MAKTKSKVRRSSKNSIDIMEASGEIETDCCPYQTTAEQNIGDDSVSGSNNRRLFTGSHNCTMNKEQPHLSENFDSGYYGSVANCRDEMPDSIKSMCSSMDLVSLTDNTIISESEIESECKRTKRTTSNSEIRQMFQPDLDGDTQLHMAIIHLLNAIAIYIINRAPSLDFLNIPNKLLQTPLHLAVSVRASDIVHWLLFRCADRQARDRNGDTPLHIACKAGYDEIVKMLLGVNTRGNRKEMSQCVDSKNYDGKTCLHVAAENTYLSVMKLLIENGANINNHESKSGKTVLHYAAETGNAILLEYLLQIPEVNIRAKTYGGYTPIMLAHGRGLSDVEYRLRQAGAELTCVANGDTDSEEEMDL